jgi:hypothetical protein
VSFIQVYFSRERRKDAVKDATEARLRLAAVPPVDLALVGDRLLIETEFRDADRQTVASAFGPQFAGAVFALPPGAWHGPLESGYGVHLVRVASRDAARPRTFADVRPQVVERWREGKQREIEAGFFKGLMTKYDVVIDESVKSVIGPLTTTPVRETTR